MQGLWSGNQFLKRSNYLKTCSTSFPGAACPTLHAELPSGCVEGHSCSSRGFSLWKRQRANALGKCQFVVDENYAWGFWSLPLWWPHHKLISGAVSLQVLCHVDRRSLQKKKKNLTTCRAEYGLLLEALSWSLDALSSQRGKVKIVHNLLLLLPL